MALALLPFFLLTNIISLSSAQEQQQQQQQQQRMVPAVFVFGDSLVDCGNNNYLPAVARADSAPNGIDFPQGATGRFSNGRTVVDVVGSLAGLPLIPPYLDPNTKGANILNGVNYASGAAGIIDETGGNYADRIPFDKQIEWFKDTLTQLNNEIGSSATSSNFIPKSIFAIIMGSNDYLNNYFLPYTKAHHNLSPTAFSQLLISLFSNQLTSLYHLGARKFIVANVGPLGCIPSTLFLNNSTGQCIQYVNNIIQIFNSQLKQMLIQLNHQLPSANYVYGDVYNIVKDISDNYAEYGFEYPNVGCCGAGPFNGQVPCLPLGLVHYCPDRTKYMFWDPYHPTDATNQILGHRLFNGGLQDVFPMNVRELTLI